MNSVLPLRTSANLSRMARRLPKYLFFALVLYWGAMFIATHIPGDALPEERLGFDKVVHFGAYAALAVLAAFTMHVMHWLNWKTAILIVVVGAAYGAIDEWLQTYSRREADIADWAADVVGVVFGVACFFAASAILWRRGRNGEAQAASARDARPFAPSRDVK
jgi:VanZ family protein